jgi:hypothetical protein
VLFRSPDDAARVVMHEEELVERELYFYASTRRHFRAHLRELAPAVAKALLSANRKLVESWGAELAESTTRVLAGDKASVAALKALFKKFPTVRLARALQHVGFPAPAVAPDDVGNDDAKPLNASAYR